MPLDPRIFSDPRERELEILTKANTTEVVEALSQFFALLLPAQYVDPEMIEFAGEAVGRSGHAGVETSIDRWVADDPAERRLELAAWFAYGYWRCVDTAYEPLILRLLARADALTIGSQTYVGALYALLVAYGTRSTRADLKSQIKQVLLTELEKLQRTGQAKGLADRIADRLC